MSQSVLRPGMYWLRNDDCVHVIVRDDQPALVLSGADADLFERWIGGMPAEKAMAEVTLCHRIERTEAHRRFRAALRRLEEAGAVINGTSSSTVTAEGS